jgi:hypothetical protein
VWPLYWAFMSQDAKSTMCKPTEIKALGTQYLDFDQKSFAPEEFPRNGNNLWSDGRFQEFN